MLTSVQDTGLIIRGKTLQSFGFTEVSSTVGIIQDIYTYPPEKL